MHVALLHWKGEVSKIKLDADKTVYDCCEDQGKLIPHGCLAGSCGSCKVEVIEGQENLSEPGAIESDTLKHIQVQLDKKFGPDFLAGKTVRLSCRMKAHGPIAIAPLEIPKVEPKT